MANSSVYIRDVHSLERLNDRIGTTGEAMANIDQNVGNYITSVRTVLEKQLDFIRQKLNEAEEVLRRAKDELSSCQASQVYIPELGGYTPSCSYEQSAVESAQRDVEDWSRKYEEGKRILGECQQEIADYATGGHQLIVTMSQEQTPKATKCLRECINNLQDILATDVSISNAESADGAVHIEPEQQQAAGSEQLEEVKDKIDEIKIKKPKKSVKGTNNAVRCRKCGRPTILCTCNKK